MNKTNINYERKNYLKKIKRQKFFVLLTQLAVIVVFLGIWELLADLNMIDSFITSQPSRIFHTLINLGSNDLWKHIWITTYETVIGFLLGTFLGIIIAIILWWSNFLAKVSEPFLVVLNSLPKVALRPYHHYMGRCWYSCYHCNGYCHLIDRHYLRKSKWFFKNR